LKIFLGCAEDSGEHLLREYLKHLMLLLPNAEFYCQGSSALKNDFPSIHLLFDRSLCNVMGFIEPLKRLPALIARQRALKQWIVQHEPILFIGIDAPDFFLSIEAFARKHGVYALHVVSPSVWAWRAGRIKTLEQSVHELHLLYAFEKNIYQGRSLSTQFIGHPLLPKNKPLKRTWPVKKLLLAPGSRTQEIKNHLPLLLQLAKKLKEQGYIESIVIAVTPGQQLLIDSYLKQDSIECMSLREALPLVQLALACSGTASLEIVAHGCPALIFYQVSSWKLFFLKFFVHTPYIGLPNILLQQSLIKEFVGPLQTMYNTILLCAQELCQERTYSSKAEHIVHSMTNLLEENAKPCLHTILTQLVSRVLMKQGAAV
jgi:lipid-A-disaccharide synthase